MSEATGWRTRLYVGAPNDTNKIDPAYLGYVKQWADFVNLEGCTRFRTDGMYKGQEEQGLVIEINQTVIEENIYCYYACDSSYFWLLWLFRVVVEPFQWWLARAGLQSAALTWPDN